MTLVRNVTARVVAAVLVAAAATLTVPVAPARAAYCSDAGGVSALVDFGALGGGTVTGCGSGSTADRAFTSAGFALEQSPRQQGFVCKVEGKPSDGNCLQTDSYWAFFVSDDGKAWVYASQGVYQQAVDGGDSVALVWQSTPDRRQPPTGPASPKPSPKPSPQPSSAPAPTATGGSGGSSGQSTRNPQPRPAVGQPTGTSGGGAAAASGGSPAGTPSTSATSPRSARASRSAGASASPSPTRSVSPTSSPSTLDATPSDEASASDTVTSEATAADGGGLPGWVPPAVIALLAVAAGGLAWARRAR